MTHRVTIKSSVGGRLRVRHVEADRAPTDGELDDLAKSVAERLGKKSTTRPAQKKRAGKTTAQRAKVEVDV